jgi:prepilin-type N-terminal cleavage/methylation domain-containing protein
MTSTSHRRHGNQAGYTLIELVIATALGVIVTGALTSVVLTGVMAANSATSRVEASGEIRNFELAAYDDFALSRLPVDPDCAKSKPCTVKPLELNGFTKPATRGNKAPVKKVTYTWKSGLRPQVVTREAESNRVVASNVTAFGWYLEGPTVVVQLTVTVRFYNASHVQSQTLRFYPRVTSP